MVAAQKSGRLLMLAPVMPADRGNGLAMRAGFFLDAYSRRFDVDLAVVPVALVSTTFGAEGTTFRHASELLLADSETAFSRACLALLHDRALAARLVARARLKVQREHDAGRWSSRVAQLVERPPGSTR